MEGMSSSGGLEIGISCITVPHFVTGGQKHTHTHVHGFNSCNKGLTQAMVTAPTTVTSTMQMVEYHVKYNTTTDQTHLKQTTVVVGGKDKPRKKSTIVVTSATLSI
jgi:hypothetical protein